MVDYERETTANRREYYLGSVGKQRWLSFGHLRTNLFQIWYESRLHFAVWYLYEAVSFVQGHGRTRNQKLPRFFLESFSIDMDEL